MLQALPNTLGNSWLAKQAQPLGMTMLCGSGGPDLRRCAVHAAHPSFPLGTQPLSIWPPLPRCS